MDLPETRIKDSPNPVSILDQNLATFWWTSAFAFAQATKISYYSSIENESCIYLYVKYAQLRLNHSWNKKIVSLLGIWGDLFVGGRSGL